jgi:hypothetical protein
MWRGSFLSSTLLFNGQWSVSVFLFYNLTTSIKRKLHILHIVNVEDRKLPLNRCCHVIQQKDWHRPLTINNVEDRKLPLNRCCQVIKQKDWQHLLRGSPLSSTLLMVNGLCQSFCFITWQHLLRGSFLSSTLLFNGRCCHVIKQKDWHRSLTIK